MKILLITSGVNNDKSNSWLVFSKFIKLMRRDFEADIEIICFSPSFKKGDRLLSEKTVTTIFRAKLLSAIMNRLTRKSNYYTALYYAKRHSNYVINYIKKNDIKKLWVNVDILSIFLLKEIINKIDINYHITVFDDPFRYRFYNAFRQTANAIFSEVFSKAQSIDTPTFMLSDDYKKDNILNTKIKVKESLVGIFIRPNKLPKIKTKVKKICLAGSVYGVDALAAFLIAIEHQMDTEQIEFHLFANLPKVYLKYIGIQYPIISKKVKILPFVKENEVINKLQEYDLLYLPMMFDKNRRFQTNTSFPSKTHNYLASGIPIIFHVPVGAALYKYAKKHSIGMIFDSLNESEINKGYNRIKSYDYRQKLSSEIIIHNNEMADNVHVEKLYDCLCEK